MTNCLDKKKDIVNVFRDGEVIQQLTIPGLSNGEGTLFSDQPGSVYASTKTSLQHFVSKAPAFGDFKLVGELPHPTDLKNQRFLWHSSQGGLLYRSANWNNAAKLHLLDLPATEPTP